MPLKLRLISMSDEEVFEASDEQTFRESLTRAFLSLVCEGGDGAKLNLFSETRWLDIGPGGTLIKTAVPSNLLEIWKEILGILEWHAMLDEMFNTGLGKILSTAPLAPRL